MDDMIITIRNKLPEVPRGLILVGENTGLTLKFDFDDEWSEYSAKTARVCIGSASTDIDFTGDTVELPLIPSSVRYIDVGVYAGDLSTTAPARIRVIPSILGISRGSGTYDPDSPDVLPAAEDVTLDDLIRMNDVSAGIWVKATIRQILAAAGAAPQLSDDDPQMDGEASPGEMDECARADHKHPTDTSRASATALADVITHINGIDDDLAAVAGLSVSVRPQTFETGQQAQARSNIGAASASELTQTQQLGQELADEVDGVKDDIAALGRGVAQMSDDIDELYDQTVRTDTQNFTELQKQQARTNIDAQEALTFDATPTVGSSNPVTSEGIKIALDDKVDKTQTVTVSGGGDVTQALDAGKIYVFTGALTSLTLTFNAVASGDLAQYHFIFSTGSTAPTLTLPSGVTMPDDWAVEADKRYEVDILDGYGVAVSWAVTV